MRSGEYSMSYAEDEEPTKPGGTEPAGSVITRLYTTLGPGERKRLAHLFEAWTSCDANGRALIEGVASELAKRAVR